MANYGDVFKKIADDPEIRWLGPHKGVVGLALASITNACWDMFAKERNLPLWKLLLDLKPEELVNMLDFSFVEDVLTKEEALDILKENQNTRNSRADVLKNGYPAYDTSCGWLQFDDTKIVNLAKQRMDRGFTALKLKVGSKDSERDIRRANLLRESVGDNT
eukprot:UN26283